MTNGRSIKSLLDHYATAFKTISDTPRLDIEVLLSHVLKKERAQLFAHPELILSEQEIFDIEQYAKFRLQGQPIAYLIGHKEFWDLELAVNPNVLIPRPETECLVEWILEHYTENKLYNVADLGVGSGAIALALAKERSNWIIHATDYSEKALELAKHNAKNYRLNNVSFYQGAWCAALPNNDYDIIVSNPPYIASNDAHLKNLSFEPLDALDGGPDGLEDIKKIIETAKNHLKNNGLLIFEHGYDQQDRIISWLENAGYVNIKGHSDLAGLPRFVTAQSKNSG